jgi:hypothetical protein
MSERSFRSEVTIKTLAKTLASSVVGRAGVIRSFEPEMSGGQRRALEASAASLKKSKERA